MKNVGGPMVGLLAVPQTDHQKDAQLESSPPTSAAAANRGTAARCLTLTKRLFSAAAAAVYPHLPPTAPTKAQFGNHG